MSLLDSTEENMYFFKYSYVRSGNHLVRDPEVVVCLLPD